MDFKDKKVAIIGAGVEGISTGRFLLDKAALVSILDKRVEKEFDREELRSIRMLPVNTKFGPDYLSNLTSFDIVFRSPGVRPDLAEILEAREKGLKIISQSKLFFDLCPAPIIGVTGTKGKGTTSTLIYEILRAAGKKALLAGNIGRPPLDVLNEIDANSFVVLELSSFQLMDMEKSPHIAVVLMVTTEHMDWHKNLDEYIKAKQNIIKFQGEKDFAVINKDFVTSGLIGAITKGEKIYFSTKETLDRGAYIEEDSIILSTNKKTKLAKINEVSLPGPHNLQNICAASLVGGILNIPDQIISQTIKAFRGIEHRLEFLGEINNVAYYNDSASTAPETTIAAINAFNRPKILILGGSSKQSDFSELGKAIGTGGVRAVILIGQEGPRIKQAIVESNYHGTVLEGMNYMKEVVSRAKDLASPGDVVIFSPACASFDMFKNYKQRGESFKSEVKALNLV